MTHEAEGGQAGPEPGAPPGFTKLPVLGASGFNGLCGGLWVKVQNGSMLGGFRVEAIHCNPAGSCHGGMLATFSDVHLALAAQFEHSFNALILPTVSLTLDYLAPTPKGAWVEARAEIMKVTRGTVFANETLLADGKPVAFARGIFKIPSGEGGEEGAPVRDTGVMLRELLGR